MKDPKDRPVRVGEALVKWTPDFGPEVKVVQGEPAPTQEEQ